MPQTVVLGLPQAVIEQLKPILTPTEFAVQIGFLLVWGAIHNLVDIILGNDEIVLHQLRQHAVDINPVIDLINTLVVHLLRNHQFITCLIYNENK